MKSWTKACWASLIAASFVAVVHADDAAIVRITDKPSPTPDAGPGAPAPAPGAPVAGAVEGAPCDGAGGAGGGCWFNPTRGYQPYASAPVYRDAIVYYRYWPDKWYGEPGFNLRPMFPQVYMPTDTTQLGFYYARVPQWMPNPNMYPPTPRPSDWHRHVIYAGGADGSCGVTSGVNVAPANAPEGPPPAAPAPAPNPSASRGWPTVPASPSARPAPSAMIQEGTVQPAAALELSASSGSAH